MIYFKFPFDEKLYSTDENPNESHISFYSFDGFSRINCNGTITEISPDGFDEATISSELLTKDHNQYIAETKDEYIQNLHQVIDVIKENRLPKLVYSRRKMVKGFEEINIKESFKILL